MPKHRRQLTTWQVFCQVERRFRNRDSNRQLGKDFVDKMSSKRMTPRQGFHSLQTHCVHELLKKEEKLVFHDLLNTSSSRV